MTSDITRHDSQDKHAILKDRTTMTTRLEVAARLGAARVVAADVLGHPPVVRRNAEPQVPRHLAHALRAQPRRRQRQQ